MDKNIAALLREDTYTINVHFINDRFPGDQTILGKDYALTEKTYTYISSIPNLQKDDLVAVYAVGIPKIVVVDSVSSEVDIRPNDTKEYSYVIAKIDFTSYLEDMKTNKEITTTVGKAYKSNLRKNFATMLLAEMDTESREKLLTVISKKQGE